MEKQNLSNGWRMSEPYYESKDAKYVCQVTEELLALPRQKRTAPDTYKGKKVSELTPVEREEFLFSMQPESTKAALERQKSRRPEDDLDYLLRPIPAYLPNPDAANLDQLTSMRPLKPDEIAAAESARKSIKNTLGESKLSSVSPERREKGIHALTYSKPFNPNPDELKKLKKLEPLSAVNADLTEPPKRYGFWKALTFKAKTEQELEDFMNRKKAWWDIF